MSAPIGGARPLVVTRRPRILVKERAGLVVLGLAVAAFGLWLKRRQGETFAADRALAQLVGGPFDRPVNSPARSRGARASGVEIRDGCAPNAHRISLDPGLFGITHLVGLGWTIGRRQFRVTVPAGFTLVLKASNDAQGHNLDPRNIQTFVGPIRDTCVEVPFEPSSMLVTRA